MKINGQFIINIEYMLGFSQIQYRQKLNTLTVFIKAVKI